MAMKSVLSGILPGILGLTLACSSGGGGGGPMGTPDNLVGTWAATHTLFLDGVPFAVCNGPFVISNATSSSLSGNFSITGGGGCIGSAQFTFTGTISGSQVTITVVGELLEELLAVCTITAGDTAFAGSASNTSLMIDRENTIQCTDPDDGSVLTGDIRWEISAQKSG